jgi:hypothetical protein
VSLSESAYGGTLALVLLPTQLVAPDNGTHMLAPAGLHGAITASGYPAGSDAPGDPRNPHGMSRNGQDPG